MEHAPNFNLYVGSKAAEQGETREQRMLRGAGIPAMGIGSGEGNIPRVAATYPQHSEYSHAQKGDSPDKAASPFGNRAYQLSVTTSPEFGEHTSHFTPQDISWSRTNQLPTEEFGGSALDPQGYKGRLMRMIDEIQSDGHQKAIDPGPYNPTDEQKAELTARLQALASRYPVDDVATAVHNPETLEEEG